MKAAEGLRRSDLLINGKNHLDVEILNPAEIEKAVDSLPNGKLSPAAQPQIKKRVRRSKISPTAAA
jgi:hypothetical protein